MYYMAYNYIIHSFLSSIVIQFFKIITYCPFYYLNFLLTVTESLAANKIV